MSKKYEPKHKSVRAIVLFSGGLDSILSTKILEEQGIDMTALTFVSYFFDAEQAKKSAQENDIKLVIRDIFIPHLAVVRNPLFGRGAGMNPCLDCHLLMLKEAKKLACETKFDFMATGEVLGQRPMSQNLRALELIEKKAGLAGKILRPLSAKIMPETEVEKSGLVARDRLFGISGRSRKAQMKLAKKYGIDNFPSPAGGCILTDKEFSKKLNELLDKVKRPKKSDIELLRLGRHFWIGRTRIVIGRNHEENLQLKKLAEKGDTLIEPRDIPGPTAFVRGRGTCEVLDFVKNILLKYTKKSDDNFRLKIISGK
jgi:tRNA-uridine 2-sulfurtransferase